MAVGKYTAAEAITASNIRAAQALRARCFGRPTPLDSDEYDSRARHFIVRHHSSGAVVCCFRLKTLHAADLSYSYSAQYYDLSALEAYDGLMMELGRFCVDPDWSDLDILRVAWAVVTALVDAEDVQMLFGCASFDGVETVQHLDALALLKARYLGPKRWLPGVKALEMISFEKEITRKPDLKKAMQGMPPLLRSYLIMGGWVSDHAVIDRSMKTLHVFTALEIGAIPEGRKRLLRALV